MLSKVKMPEDGKGRHKMFREEIDLVHWEPGSQRGIKKYKKAS